MKQHKHLVRKPTSKEKDQLFLLCAGTRGLPDGIRETKTDYFIESWFEELGFLRKKHFDAVPETDTEGELNELDGIKTENTHG